MLNVGTGNVYADSAISLGQYYVQAYNGSYDVNTDTISFNSRYTLSGVGFNLPNSNDYYTFISSVDNLYIEYYSSLAPSGFSGLTLASGDNVKIYSNSSQTVDLKIMCNSANVSSMPNPFILSDNVAVYNGDPPVNNVIRYPYTFQNGYLFVYDLGQSGAMYSFDLTSKSEEYSNLGEYPFPDTNQAYWFSDTLPEIDETTIPDSNATVIHWLKGLKQNIFGQTQDMVANISGTSTGRYLYIYNPPAHYKWVGNSNPTASETVNYPVTVNGVSSGDNFYIYDSVARLADYNQGGKVQGTVGEMGIGEVDENGNITVSTTDGAIYNQVSGGSTDISGANGGSITENINGLKQTLDNFVNQFIQLLSAPISHIQQLIQSGNSFFDVFGQLFDWLPSSVSSVLISGLIIMVVIGVLKMLL